MLLAEKEMAAWYRAMIEPMQASGLSTVSRQRLQNAFSILTTTKNNLPKNTAFTLMCAGTRWGPSSRGLRDRDYETDETDLALHPTPNNMQGESLSLPHGPKVFIIVFNNSMILLTLDRAKAELHVLCGSI